MRVILLIILSLITVTASALSPKGVALVKQFEGLRLVAYNDHGRIAIGYGSTEGVKLGMRVTKKQAEALLQRDLQRFERAVLAVVKVDLTLYQLDALVLFSYNVGIGALKSSTLLKKLNAGDIQGAANEFLRWNRAGGKVYKGLSRRRAAERELFLTEL